ncbi:MAG TPA: ATP-binding cassette domain-containing protein [Brevibacterium senegalense]|uniref:ATP-binding cassette domain-containing protein n=1 Tax=Brevibacterium senegalense TaxID=1033736 RepID=A0A921MCZ8_9MICO|nr:ATP-binding cassette domain-containing protein [Brevibacterium senegalense]
MSKPVTFERVSKSFEHRGRTVQALDDVSLSIDPGDIYAIVGYSGAGKSTLLRTVNALERPTTGSVFVGDQDMTQLRGKELLAARQRIGMVFQQFNLLKSRSIYKNIAYPLRLAGLSESETIDRVEELLEFVGLSDKALQYPSQLSGGQKQRVGIARALATRPDVLISDEATSALDPETTLEVLGLLKRVNEEYGVTVLLVTHEMEAVREIADRVAVMQNGRIIEEGSVYSIFSNPQTDTAKRFVASVLRHRPDARSLSAIRRVHTGRLVEVRVGDRQTNDPFLSRIAREHGVDFNIVYGGVSESKDTLFGRLTVELLGGEQDVAATIASLREITDIEEVAV